MTTNPNTFALETSLANVPSHITAHSKQSSSEVNYEVKIRPLPPEIEKLVRKYLSRY